MIKRIFYPCDCDYEDLEDEIVGEEEKEEPEEQIQYIPYFPYQSPNKIPFIPWWEYQPYDTYYKENFVSISSQWTECEMDDSFDSHYSITTTSDSF